MADLIVFYWISPTDLTMKRDEEIVVMKQGGEGGPAGC